ncbi:coenzyme PQQ precursor peptide PqqA [Endobacter medicaginis]|uniref:Coenzyme PQQ synthesis protein A n=2 Tax=Endobacter medicaginis TaxID=1181271 RepID=A0A839UXQ5_9PROT|nr:pyrroloquinoline quinone precursor peptide PqqA [Endobacter medicaginis]MBB3173153.1 coenzyme PQQ precursor peptide PqqA [Endobacter medicaginis]MCX5476095.1 pyrroloquinoline quinone precursor peptide PqqA [Endobacter medicaginis]
METTRRSVAMTWKTPRIVEICLGAEINSYVSATLRG